MATTFHTWANATFNDGKYEITSGMNPTGAPLVLTNWAIDFDIDSAPYDKLVRDTATHTRYAVDSASAKSS